MRCSSERPSCKRCIRLRRVCSYVSDVASGYVASQSRKASPPPPSYAADLSPGRTSISSVKVPLLQFEQPLPRLPAQEHYLGIPKTLLSSLVDVFFSHIYNASLLLRKCDFLDSIAKGTARHHLVLSVCAFAAMYDPFPCLGSVLFANLWPAFTGMPTINHLSLIMASA